MHSAEAISVVTAAPVRHRSADYLELESLGDRIVEAAGHVAAATGVWLGMVAEFERRGGWSGTGIKSCAHWLTWRCGLGLHAAREHVRVARALEGLPLVRAELTAGRLSYSKVRAMTRVADSSNEEGLLNVALHSTGAQLEKTVAGFKRAHDFAAAKDRHARRRLSWRWDADGMLVISGRFSPEDGAAILAALESVRAEVATTDPEDERPARVGPEVDADSMVALAQHALEHAACAGGDAAAHVVNLHVELTELIENPELAEGRVEDGPSVAPETLRRLCCDSAAVVVAHHRSGGTGTSLDIGRQSRVIPRRLRRALDLRDGGCRFPGCGATRFLHRHHVLHWSRGGRTDLANLMSLCTFHHHAVHEGGFEVIADGLGGFGFVRPDGTPLESFPLPVGGDSAMATQLHDATIDAWTATPRWYGEKLDLPYVVSVLLSAAELN
ncbi:MAG: DUF222 domain-containing protein [Sporichthyaceae bacterium]